MIKIFVAELCASYMANEWNKPDQQGLSDETKNKVDRLVEYIKLNY